VGIRVIATVNDLRSLQCVRAEAEHGVGLLLAAQRGQQLETSKNLAVLAGS
jgi:hypothetical protein